MTLKVIGAGLGRTGTMSLKLALERLGLGRCYHMVEVFQIPEAVGQWTDVGEGRGADWETIFAGYSATVDWPAATYWRELADRYPDAKVILTHRDPKAWFRSTQQTIFAQGMEAADQGPFSRMAGAVVGSMFDGRLHDEDHVIAVFNAHNEAVKRAIPPERLLVYEVSEGWAPLCAFLGVAVPDEPMPKTNSTEEFQARLRAGAGAPH
jgi:hypothetical protein